MKYRLITTCILICIAALATIVSSLFVTSPQTTPRAVVYRRPLTTGHGIDYYTDGIHVYERTPPDCGLLSFIEDCDEEVANRPPYAYDKLVSGADPSSFQYVGDFSSVEAQFYGQGSTAEDIYRDKDHVIYQGRVILSSDACSLQLFPGYAKDYRNVYFQGFTLTGLDPETFRLVGKCGFYRDKNGIYSLWTGLEDPLPGVDQDTFEVINPERCATEKYVRDKNHLYVLDEYSRFRIVK